MISALAMLVVGLFLTGLYRWVALRSGWLDHPNQRSSHTEITPRGAGILFGLLIIIFAELRLDQLPELQIALLFGIPVIALGWWDDIRGVSIKVRFVGYALSSIAAIISLQSTESILFLFVAALTLLWLINLYNFMDGINGIAAFEAIFVLFAAILFAPSNANAMSIFLLGSCGAIAGYLIWNFPFGKIFMGDAGSAFLGFLLGTLMFSSHQWGGPAPLTWVILLGIFICDSSYTLIRRMLTGQQWYSAHRLHAYQKLARRLSSHTKAVTVIMVVNVCWLLPWAWCAERRVIESTAAFVISYLPLIIATRVLNAGRQE